MVLPMQIVMIFHLFFYNVMLSVVRIIIIMTMLAPVVVAMTIVIIIRPLGEIVEHIPMTEN